MKTRVINLYGGPCAGKSVTAVDIFSNLKKKGLNVELVTEYAKDMTWEDRHNILCDPDYIFAKQHRRQRRLVGKVDIIITDSPLRLSTFYASKYAWTGFPVEQFTDMVNLCDAQFDNFNVFLDRAGEYNPVGRNQTEEEADAFAEEIYNHTKYDLRLTAKDSVSDDIINAFLEG